MRTKGRLRGLTVRAGVFLFSGLIAACRYKVAPVIATTPTGGPLILPAGSVLALIAADNIDSSDPVMNRAYAAVVSRDIKEAAPQTILPSGSPANLVLMSTNEAGQSSWQLGISSVMVNGDSFLAKTNGNRGAPVGTFLGGVSGPDYSVSAKGKIGESTGLIVSRASMHISAGSLLTFRLQEEMVLTGSGH